ncbi:MAG: hypothetical protein QGG67_12320 [Gammaproteobacteria bacterium]|nr:hypothetical protein [Gammaproteobacteria bacterium]MDP7455205.1 hypothetical protein [Gammaproteobacteria bacterium]
MIAAVVVGFPIGFLWYGPLFEQRSFQYTAIVGGYWIVIFTLMGLILGAWK